MEEGRIESPLQSSEQWNELFKNAEFSGVDLVAYNPPVPERHSALLLFTALANPKKLILAMEISIL
jgi:hypothetical protein